MKKKLFFAVSTIFFSAAFGQSNLSYYAPVNPLASGKILSSESRAVFDLGSSHSSGNLSKKAYAPPQLLGNATQIGTTTYDLQTNRSVANRIAYNADGTIQATWTFSSELNTSWTDRGTGYNYFNGSSWNAFPTTRIENGVRAGWPEMVSLANGSEVVISHAPALSVLLQSSRAQKGTGAWNTVDLTQLAPGSILWPRAVAGGPDGNTIHLIAHNEATTVVNGVTGMIYYSRSPDGGLNWDI